MIQEILPGFLLQLRASYIIQQLFHFRLHQCGLRRYQLQDQWFLAYMIV